MAWTAGSDVTTGDLITAAKWNTYLGASGSLEYLKTEADKVDDVASGDVTGSRALDTNYQNTTGKTILCVVTCDAENTEAEIHACVESGDVTPDLVVAMNTMDKSTGNVFRAIVAFVVPKDYYYTVKAVGGSESLKDWFEYTLH